MHNYLSLAAQYLPRTIIRKHRKPWFKVHYSYTFPIICICIVKHRHSLMKQQLVSCLSHTQEYVAVFGISHYRTGPLKCRSRRRLHNRTRVTWVRPRGAIVESRQCITHADRKWVWTHIYSAGMISPLPKPSKYFSASKVQRSRHKRLTVICR